MTRLWYYAIQIAIALGVGFGLASTDIPMDPRGVIICAVFAAIAVTWLIGAVIDSYRYGFFNAFPKEQVIRIGGAILLVVFGFAVILTVGVYGSLKLTAWGWIDPPRPSISSTDATPNEQLNR